MSEHEHDDGRCCDNGYFGQQHDCQKQNASDRKEPRGWWIFEHNEKDDPYEAHGFVFDDKEDISDLAKESAVNVIEKSAYDALKKEIEKLQRDNLLALDMTEKFADERDQLKAEVAELKEQLLLKPEPVQMRTPDMSDAYEEKIDELNVELAAMKELNVILRGELVKSKENK